MAENAYGIPQNAWKPTDNFREKRGKRFGRDKPAIPGPGRPRLPDSVKERRAFLRKSLEEISVDATKLLTEIVNDPTEETRDRIRAAEISLSHALPRQEEVDINESSNIFTKVDPAELPRLLEVIDAEIADRPKTGDGSSGATA